jgi:hypothetical protein
MPSDISAVMKRFFSPPSAGRKLQRKSGPPSVLLGSSAEFPEDLDAPLRYFPGRALHADYWEDGVRPTGFKYPSGREARLVVPILGMCGVGRTCVSNYVRLDCSHRVSPFADNRQLQDGYWGGQQPSDAAETRAQRYFCDGVIYKISTVEVPPRSQFNSLLKQFAEDSISVPIVITYSVTWRESFDVACRLFDQLRGALTRAKLPVLVMLMGLRKDLESIRQVNRPEAEAFAKQRGILFAETSAMTGRGVRGAFGMLVEAIQRHGETLPKGIESSSLVERQRFDDLKQEIFRLGIECFETTKDRRCPAYQSRWDPGVQAPVLRPPRIPQTPVGHHGMGIAL